MVSGGSIEFNIGIDRPSLQRAVGTVEDAFKRSNPRVSFDDQQVNREAQDTARRVRKTVQDQVDDIPVGFKIDAQGRLRDARGRFVSTGRDAGQGFNAGFAGSIAIGNIVADASQAAVRAVFSAFQGAAGIIGQASQEFRNFDAAVTRFTAKAGQAAPDQIERISESAREFAAVTQFTPTEVQNLATQLLSLGATADQVEQNLGAITKTADALGEDAVITGRTIQGAVAVYEQLGLTAERASDILGSAIANTAAGSRSGISEFEQLFSRAGASAASLGIEVEQLVALFAAFRQTGATAQVSATAIQKVLQSLSTEAEKLAENGIDIAFDENGAVNLEDTLRNLEARLQGLSGTERIDFLSQLFNPKTASDLNAALAQLDTSFQTALDTGRNSVGEIDRQVDILNQSLERQRQLIGGNLSAIFTSFGQAFEPVEQAVTGIVAQIVSDLGGAEGALDPLTAAAERFQLQIQQNPEIVEQISDAFVTLARTGVDSLAGVIDALTALFANEQAVENLAGTIEDLGGGFEVLGQFTQGLIGATEIFLSLGSAAEVAGSALRGAFNATSFLAPLITSLQQVLGLVEDIRAQLNLIEADAFDQSVGSSVDDLASNFNRSLGTSEQSLRNQQIELPPINNDAAVESAGRSAEELAAAQREALSQVATDTANALAEIETSQAQQIAAIRQRQLDGIIGEEDAADQIASIQSNSTDQVISEKQRELAEVQRLKAEGVITEEQAAQEITALQGQIADETLNRIEQEIAAQERAKQAVLDKLDSESDRVGQLQNIRDLETEIANTTLNAQQSLLSAQQSLASSRSNLAQLELEGALQRAEAEGDINAATQIRGQLLQQQQQAIAQEQQFKQQQLNLQIQQNQLESQRAIQLAEVAAIEADIAVQRARAEGASSDEISGLERIADLRNTQVDQAREAAANQNAINGALQEQLNVEGQIAEEKARQAQQDEDRISNIRQATEEQRRLQEQLADNQQQIDSTLAGAFQVSGDDPRQNIRDIENQFRSTQSAGLFDSAAGNDFQQVLRELNGVLGGSDTSILQAASRSADQELFGQLLSQVGRGDLGSLVNADSEIDQLKQAQEPIVNELQLLNTRIEELANAPRALTVQTPDPVADAGRIVSDIQRDSLRRVNP